MTAVHGSPPPPPSVTGDAACLPGGYKLLEYQIERALGVGGFGITYLARDVNLNLPVAIKEYFPGDSVARIANHQVQVRSNTQEMLDQYNWGLERFLDEARALATFRHPNIVRVLRYFRENSTAYIVMEYESGDPLKRWVPQNAPLTQRALLSIIYPLLDGLAAVHKTGFLHRDIKPDNIYVRADGTPVLLDFGAARRVTANHDLTNIVSPGFAPFEQYHSQGNQGPWTDIYSLGAVMYWMTTGKKPAESASRIKTDSMLPASSLAEASVFGTSLLEAIDWAIQPDENRRPQNVAEFRAAIQGSERPDTQSLDFDLDGERPGLGAAGYVPQGTASSGTPSTPPGSSPSGFQRKNLLCTIMFLDLIGYSVRSVDDQVALKKLFNEVIGKALKGVDESTRIAIDTGDGAAICFMGDPEEALHSAMLLRDLLSQRYGTHLSVRIGLHMGPVRVIADINERVNVVGDGINVAQRIMDFAEANQVLVSRAYYDVISRITDDTAEMFEYLGQYSDKHARLHEVYCVANGPRGSTRREGPATGYTQTVPVASTQALDAAQVAEVESDLTRLIGPLSRVLVRKALPLARSIAELREALAPSIQEDRTREAFVNGTMSHGHSHSRPASQSQSLSSRPMPLSQPLSQPVSRSGSRPSRSMPPSQTLSSSRLEPTRRTPTRPEPSMPLHSTRQMDIPPEELAIIEHTLSKFIGPMAKMLIRKEATRSSTYKEFVAAVAANIDHPQQREVFMQALRRALPQR
ncbi:MAG: protein kinase [Ramlibacter sp.]|nr:protein kinase [Ramlibacter sp.]MCW5650698.1 protein kinase [Ramlibacter sp.]